MRKHRHAILSLVALCIMYVVFTGLVFNTISLYAYWVDADGTASFASYLNMISLIGVVSAVLTLVAYGPIVGKLGLKKTLGISAIFMVVALLIFSFMTNELAMYAGGLLFGVAITFLAVSSTGIGVNTWFARNVGKMQGIVTMCGGVAGIVFPLIVAQWIGVDGSGWRTSFQITAAITAVLSIFMFVLYTDSPAKVGETPMWSEDNSDGEKNGQNDEAALSGPSKGKIFSTPQFWILCIAYLGVGIAFYSIVSIMNTYALTHVPGIDATAAAGVLSIIFAATAVAMVPGGAICDKIGSKWFIVICAACLIVSIGILMSNPDSIFIIDIAAVFIGIAYVSLNVPVVVSVREGLGTRDYAQKVPIVTGFMLAGVAIGPALIGALSPNATTTGDFNLAFSVYIVITVIVAILMFPGTKLAKGERKEK